MPIGEESMNLFSLYEIILNRDTLIYNALNKLKRQNDQLYGYFWIPTSEVPQLEKALESLRTTHAGLGDGFMMPRVFHVD